MRLVPRVEVESGLLTGKVEMLVISRGSVEMFFNEFDDKKAGDRAEHDSREEKRVADLFLNPTGDGSG